MQRLLLQRFFLALLLAGACVGSSLGCGGALSLEDVDPMHPGGRPELGLPVLSFRWKFAVADRATESIPQEFSSAAVASGRVFIGSATGELDALDADTGALLWRTRLGGIATRPVVERGRLYLGTSDGAMVCLDAMEGTVLWRYVTRGPVLQPPALVDDTLYFSNEADQVYALEADSGAFRWQYKQETPDEYTLRGHAGVAVADGLVFTGFTDGTAVALRASTGSVAWITSIKGEAERFVDVDATPIARGGAIFVSSSSGGVHALDATTGLVRWRLAIEGAGGLAADDQRLYVGAADTGIYALDFSGHTLWRQGTRGGGEPAPPVVNGDYLLYALSDAGLYIVDKRTGRVLQYFEPGEGVSAAPTIDGEELFVMSNRGILYGFRINRFDL